MELNFTEEDTTKEITFKDIVQNQFFVDDNGFLSQKRDESSYSLIADEEGIPWGGFVPNAEPSLVIRRLLPRVTKINF